MCGNRTARTAPSVATRQPGSPGRPGPAAGGEQARELLPRLLRVGVVAADARRRPVRGRQPGEQPRAFEEELLVEPGDRLPITSRGTVSPPNRTDDSAWRAASVFSAVEQADQVEGGAGEHQRAAEAELVLHDDGVRLRPGGRPQAGPQLWGVEVRHGESIPGRHFTRLPMAPGVTARPVGYCGRPSISEKWPKDGRSVRWAVARSSEDAVGSIPRKSRQDPTQFHRATSATARPSSCFTSSASAAYGAPAR